METLYNYVAAQYEAVQETRKVLLEFCKIISPPRFVQENPSFGRGGSIRNLMVHIANVYQFWIAKNALNKPITFTEYISQEEIGDIVALFDNVDIFMNEFINLFQLSDTKQIEYEINGKKNSVIIGKLFTHVITHEFHHKGQILSISRQLGYTPVDTDIIR